MNFSREQQTGELAELAVRALFTKWGWLAGRDFLDAGYDLSVEPSRDVFHGSRFMVQVKGTLQNGWRGLTVNITKDRLRMYAENRIPVFIVRSTPDGKLYWLHAQEWAKGKEDRLLGDGRTGVRFDRERQLDDKEQFSNYLIEVFRPLAQRRGSISSLIRDRETYLSGLDERIDVRIEADRKGESVSLYGRGSGEVGRFQFRPTADPQNLSKLRNLFEFGLTATVEADDFRMTGSALYEALGLTDRHQGRLTISPTHTTPGSIRLLAGSDPSPLAPTLALEAALSAGSRGVSFSNGHTKSLLDLTMRVWDGGEEFQMDIHIAVRDGLLSRAPIKDIAELDALLNWAEAALDAEGLSVELDFTGRARLPALADQLREALAFFRYVAQLGRLHKVALFLNSPLVIEDKPEVSEHEENMIDLAYQILRGERCPVSDFSAELEGIGDLQISDEMIYQVCTNLQLTVGGKVLGKLPIAVELERYTIEDDGGKKRLIGKAGGQAWVTYDEHGHPDLLMTRKPG